MVGSFHNPVLQWTITILLECVFLGFFIVFIGQGLTQLRKKKEPFKNLCLIAGGLLMAILSVIATILLLQGRS